MLVTMGPKKYFFKERPCAGSVKNYVFCVLSIILLLHRNFKTAGMKRQVLDNELTIQENLGANKNMFKKNFKLYFGLIRERRILFRLSI
jgi:hypothetical protein